MGIFIIWHSQAEEIAEKLCESVAASLEGKKLASFTRISSTVQVCRLDNLLIYLLLSNNLIFSIVSSPVLVMKIHY